MSNSKLSPTRLRERAVFRYRGALERGDFKTVAEILQLAERDPILWSMIDGLAELDGEALERPAPPTRAPRNDPHITQVITRRDPPPNGQTPKPDHSQEDNDMNSLTMNTFL